MTYVIDGVAVVIVIVGAIYGLQYLGFWPGKTSRSSFYHPTARPKPEDPPSRNRDDVT